MKKIKTCDPEMMKKIVFDWLESMNKACENGELTNSSLYFGYSDSASKFIGDNFEEINSYSWRINCVMGWIGKNRESLTKMGLVKKTETHSLTANVIYEAAATCEVGRRGFNSKNMLKEIKKYLEKAQ